jgi:ubiquinone/menaquinone biosynthesis C-methylase UbiE
MEPVAFYKKFSKEYDERDLYNLLYAKWLFTNIIRQINKEKSKILDFGTGTGELAIRIAKEFPKSEVIGNDISKDMINLAKKKVSKMGIKNIKFIVSPMERLNVNKIDFVVSRLVFHHIKNKKFVVSKIYDVLPKKGRLIIGDGFHPSKEYIKGVEKLRMKNPKRAKEFDESLLESIRRTSKEYSKNRPKEFPIGPTDLKNIMRNVGFKKQRIVKSLIPKFSVVIGEK